MKGNVLTKKRKARATPNKSRAGRKAKAKAKAEAGTSVVAPGKRKAKAGIREPSTKGRKRLPPPPMTLSRLEEEAEQLSPPPAPEGDEQVAHSSAVKKKTAKSVAPRLVAVPKPDEAKGKKGKPAQLPVTAETMADRQREISVAEFFQKNRHLLGFDNPRKALLTAIKEAVDNSLDACEEARMLPDIKVEIHATKHEDRFRVVVEDNGPGIVQAQIGRIFGKLLYGSKFHRLKMSRGQQGIGISAAGMYGQLTTGRPAKITSRISPDKPARYYEIMMNTTKNEPVILRNEEVDWKCDHGTRVEIVMAARYQKGRQSIDEYLEQTAIANPHVRISYRTPDGVRRTFSRASQALPAEPKEIKPHPHGVELGLLMKMLKDSKERTLTAFLHQEFSRVSTAVARRICEAAKVRPKAKPSRLAHEEVEALYHAIDKTKLMAPPTNCLAPIGAEEIRKGLKKQINADFYEAVSRKPAVYRGNPFLVEAGIAWGGEQPPEGLARVLRFANRVPLLYQRTAGAIYDAVVDTAWRNYHVPQSRGALPSGPLTIMVHFASAWVPFTSESKEAIADYPEIHKEMRLALQECGRRLAQFLRRRRRAQDAERKKSYIEKYIPHIAIGLREILSLSGAEQARTEKRLKAMLEKRVANGNGNGDGNSTQHAAGPVEGEKPGPGDDNEPGTEAVPKAEGGVKAKGEKKRKGR
jgi:DNA topoisomerase-6 subunit B